MLSQNIRAFAVAASIHRDLKHLFTGKIEKKERERKYRIQEEKSEKKLQSSLQYVNFFLDCLLNHFYTIIDKTMQQLQGLDTFTKVQKMHRRCIREVEAGLLIRNTAVQSRLHDLIMSCRSLLRGLESGGVIPAVDALVTALSSVEGQSVNDLMLVLDGGFWFSEAQRPPLKRQSVDDVPVAAVEKISI